MSSSTRNHYTMDELVVDRVTTLEGLSALEAEWQRLLEARTRWLPFETPQWHLAWWAHLPEHKPWVADALYTCTVRTPGGELVGVAPLMRTQRPGLGPIGFRALDFIGPDPNLTELRSLVSHPAHEAAVFRALRRALHEQADGWHWMHWRGVPQGSEAERSLAQASGVRGHCELENYTLELPATWDELRSTRPRNLKESLRKCYNSLKRDGHTFSLEVAQSPSEVEAALGRFFELHRARSRAGDTVSHNDVFAAKASRAFVLDACRRLAERGAARVFELRIGQAVVASRVGFVLGESLYLYYSGYDPKWGDYSVMTTTVAEAMKYAIAAGLKEVNLSFGTDVSKTRWAPQRRVYVELVEPSPSHLGRVAYPAYLEFRRWLEHERVRGLVHRTLRRRAKLA